MKPTVRRTAVLAGLAVAAANLHGCMTAKESGFVIDPAAVTCAVDVGSELSVLEIPLTVEPDLAFEPDILGVEFDSPDDVTLAGIGMADETPGYETGEPLTRAALDALAVGRDDTKVYLPVDRAAGDTLLVLLEPSGPAAGTIESFRLFWGGGEPIYWQVLPVSVTVDDSSCTATPN